MDVLQRLGLVGPKPFSTGASLRSVPQGVIPFKLGVIFTQRARIEVPVGRVIPTTLATNLTFVLSLCSHRVNNAFLFTVKSKKKRLQLGVQFVPGKIIVFVGHKCSVYFDYNVHDGHWHNLAIDIRGQTVTLFTSCGKQRLHADLPLKKDEALDPEGSFLLGKLNQHSVQFEGAFCQFDIYPSAKAAHNYCKYLKKQCRQADTYRPNLLPLVPLLPTDPRASERCPLQSDHFLLGLKNLTTVIPPSSFFKAVTPLKNKKLASASTTITPSKPAGKPPTTKAAKVTVTSSPVLPSPEVQLRAHTVHRASVVRPQTSAVVHRTTTTTVALVVSRSSSSVSSGNFHWPNKNDSSVSPSSTPDPILVVRKKVVQKTTKATLNPNQIKSSAVPSTMKPMVKKTQNLSISLHPVTVKQKPELITKGPVSKKTISLPALRQTYPTIVAVASTKPTLGAVYPVIRINVRDISLSTPAATEGYQLSGPIEPTLFPFVMGLPGPKGDPGPMVSPTFLTTRILAKRRSSPFQELCCLSVHFDSPQV